MVRSGTVVVVVVAAATVACCIFLYYAHTSLELLVSNTNNAEDSKNALLSKALTSFLSEGVTATVTTRTTTPDMVTNTSDWDMILSTDPPFSNMVPQLDVIWSRGWYTTQLFPPWIPMGYYHSRKYRFWKSKNWDMNRVFQPTRQTFSHQTLWVRREAELEWYFLDHIWPTAFVNLTLVTTDGDGDVPTDRLLPLVTDPRLTMWYSQNMIWYDHDKLKPLPIGLDLHSGGIVHGGEGRTAAATSSPVEVLETMKHVRDKCSLSIRSNLLLYDPGTTTTTNNDPKHARRNANRQDLANAIQQCHRPRLVHRMNKTDKISAWTQYGSHVFGIAPAGIGWDTHRLWEYLFFGTIPIVKSSPLDVLLVQAHVPVVILDDWSELCTFNATEVRNTFGGWMQRAHEWLKPGLWLPRNQDRMEALCDATMSCRRVYEERKHLLQKWKAPVVPS